MTGHPSNSQSSKLNPPLQNQSSSTSWLRIRIRIRIRTRPHPSPRSCPPPPPPPPPLARLPYVLGSSVDIEWSTLTSGEDIEGGSKFRRNQRLQSRCGWVMHRCQRGRLRQIFLIL
uniref:Uncharacterized protein n=1 Tax=Salix viminalis TaxID=40686 RepID=A0A6N2MIA5_SALVM